MNSDMKLIYYNTRFRGEWDFISGVRLQGLKNKAKIYLVHPESVQISLQEYKNTELAWELKWGFVKAAVHKYN